jgi:hypothetical protein
VEHAYVLNRMGLAIPIHGAGTGDSGSGSGVGGGRNTAMATYKIDYLVGSLASGAINRTLSQALIRLAPEDLEFTEIPIRDPPVQRGLRRRFPARGTGPTTVSSTTVASLPASPWPPYSLLITVW